MFVVALNRRKAHKILSDGLIAHWPLEGHVKDVVGTAHGTIRGTAVTQQANGIRIYGKSSGVTFGNQTWWSGVDSKFSVVTDTIINSVGNYKFMAQQTDSACSEDQRGFSWDTASGYIRLLFNSKLNAGATVEMRSVAAMTYGERMRLCLTYDGSIDTDDGFDRMLLYKNGASEALANTAEAGTLGDIQHNTALTGIVSNFKSTGAVCFVPGVSTDAFTRDVRVYDRVLTEEEAILITAGVL